MRVIQKVKVYRSNPIAVEIGAESQGSFLVHLHEIEAKAQPAEMTAVVAAAGTADAAEVASEASAACSVSL